MNWVTFHEYLQNWSTTKLRSFGQLAGLWYKSIARAPSPWSISRNRRTQCASCRRRCSHKATSYVSCVWPLLKTKRKNIWDIGNTTLPWFFMTKKNVMSKRLSSLRHTKAIRWSHISHALQPSCFRTKCMHIVKNWMLWWCFVIRMSILRGPKLQLYLMPKTISWKSRSMALKASSLSMALAPQPTRKSGEALRRFADWKPSKAT